MRISDWSSDVCSSDLLGVAAQAAELETSTGDVLHAGVRAAVRRQTVVDGAALRRTECRQRRGGLRRIALATQDGDNGEQHGGERRQHTPFHWSIGMRCGGMVGLIASTRPTYRSGERPCGKEGVGTF